MPSISSPIIPTSTLNPVLRLPDNKVKGLGIFTQLSEVSTIQPLIRCLGYVAVVHGQGDSQTYNYSLYIYIGPDAPDPDDILSTIPDDDWNNTGDNWKNLNEIASAVSAYNNTGDNRLLTSGGSSIINGEEFLTFDGSVLKIIGSNNERIEIAPSDASIKFFNEENTSANLTIPYVNSVSTISQLYAVRNSEGELQYTFPSTAGTAGQIIALNAQGNGLIFTDPGTSDVQITSNANNRVITGGTGSNIQGEASLQFDGTALTIGGGSDVLSILSISEGTITRIDQSEIVIQNPKINNAFTLPNAAGASGQVLTSNGNGGTSWLAPTPYDPGSGGVPSVNSITGPVSINGVSPIVVTTNSENTSQIDISIPSITTADVTESGGNLYNVQSDWNATEGPSQIANLPTNFVNSISNSDGTISITGDASTPVVSLGAVAFGSLSNVSVNGVSNDQSVKYLDGSWVPFSPLTISDVQQQISVNVNNWGSITDIPENVTSVAAGEYIKDVQINSTPATNNTINFIGSSPISVTYGSGNDEDGVTDIVISYTGPTVDPDGNVTGASNLAGLSDVELFTPTTNHILVSNEEQVFSNQEMKIPVTTDIEELEESVLSVNTPLNVEAQNHLILVKETDGWKKMPFDFIYANLSEQLQAFFAAGNINVASGTGYDYGADINQDGLVGTNDLLALLGAYNSVQNSPAELSVTSQPVDDLIQTYAPFPVILDDFWGTVGIQNTLDSYVNNRIKLPPSLSFTPESNSIPAEVSMSVYSSEDVPTYPNLISISGIEGSVLAGNSLFNIAQTIKLEIGISYTATLQVVSDFSMLFQIRRFYEDEDGNSFHFDYCLKFDVEANAEDNVLQHDCILDNFSIDNDNVFPAATSTLDALQPNAIFPSAVYGVGAAYFGPQKYEISFIPFTTTNQENQTIGISDLQVYVKLINQ